MEPLCGFIVIPSHLQSFATAAKKIIAKQSVRTSPGLAVRACDQQGIVTFVLLHFVPLFILLLCSALCLKSHPGTYPLETFFCTASVRQTHTQMPPHVGRERERESRREGLTVIDNVCITNICATDSCSPFTSHYIVACDACHGDRMAVTPIRRPLL